MPLARVHPRAVAEALAPAPALALALALALAPALALAIGALASPARAERVTVFAAASLRTALDDIAARFEEATGHDVAISYAGSSALARHIQQGAPADLFISANPDWMDLLEAEGLVAPERRVALLGNRLVLIAHGASAAPIALTGAAHFAQRLGEGPLAMALVEAVPAGVYGKAALSALGLWSAVAPRVAQTDNARAALALVALGEAPLGVVYATDALAEPRVSVAAIFPADSHPPIRYPAAVLAGRDRGAALALFAYLRGPEARATFIRHGFAVLEDPRAWAG